jgi:CxxC-x17-CxxC domain-containing protein
MRVMTLEPKKEVIYFGRANFRGNNRLFGIKQADRRQHMYVIGKTGTGKTALLHNLVVQDIANGGGLSIIDPHGEFAEAVLEKIPKERVNDVIYFNPADPDHHIGFNILDLPDPKYKHLVASGLMGVFTKIWFNVWSARMEYILNNAILALLDTPGSTLLGVNRILVDKEYRQAILNNVKDPVVRSFWINEYEQWKDQFRNEAIAPIQNKVGQFLSTALIRNIVGQAKSTIDIFDIMNSGKVLIINVSKGRIGEDNSSLLGAMLITKMQLSAMERVRIPEEERRDFFLYVDEFQNFATDSFAGILSEARKYRLDLIIAHQYIGQLVTETSTRVRDAVFGNVGTMMVFRVGAADAEFLEKEFEPEVTPQDLVNLPNYYVYLKLMVDGLTSRPFSAVTLPPFKVKASPSVKEHIIVESCRRYARPRAEVELEIERWSSGLIGEGGRLVSSSGKHAAVCAVCSKQIQVPFEPQPGRPIYCRDCLVKIKAGEIKPMPTEKTFAAKPQARYFVDLSRLGIEFEPRQERPSPSDRRRQSIIKEGEPAPVTAASQPSKPVSLSELKSFSEEPEKVHKVHPHEHAAEPDIKGLRDALKEALGKLE